MKGSMRGYQHPPAVKAKMLELVADGMTKTAACEVLDLPKETVASWIANDEEFAVRWRRARIEQVHTMVDRMLEIAEEEVDSMEQVQRNKLRIETQKWVVSKWAPRLYGEKLKEDHTQQQAVILLPAVDGSGGLKQIVAPLSAVPAMLAQAASSGSSSNGGNGNGVGR